MLLVMLSKTNIVHFDVFMSVGGFVHLKAFGGNSAHLGLSSFLDVIQTAAAERRESSVLFRSIRVD